MAIASIFTVSSISNAASNKVAAIEVSGNSATSTETIAATITTRKGDTYSREKINSDIKALWKLGLFRDVEVEMKEEAGGIVLTYIVKEKPVITKIDFDGNKKLKDDDLREEVTVKTYYPLDEKLLAETLTKIKDAYKKKDFYLASVDYHLKDLEGNEAELVFDIRENKKAIIRKIEFVGNHAFKDRKLRKVIKTKEKHAFSWLNGSGKFIEEQLEQDVGMLTFHYLQNGYIKVKVDTPKVAITKDKRYIFITYYVEEGSQYKHGSIGVDGDILTTKEELLSKLKVESGKIYNQKTVEEDVMGLTDFYGESGYAFVHVRQKLVPNDKDLTADLTYVISKGNRIRIEQINILGNTITRDKVVRRELKIKEGDIYNTRLVDLSRQKLMQLGYFEEVNFATPRGSSDDSLILNITVKEKPTGAFNIGAGFSTAENFIFTASIVKENFFGYGIGGQISAELSSRRQQFVLEFRDPYFLDSQWMLSASAYRTMYRFNDFDRESWGGTVTVGHRIFDNCSVSLGYQVESVVLNDFSLTVPEIFRQNASGLTSGLVFTVDRDTRNNRIFPTKGMYHAVTQEFSGTKLGGDNDFYRVTGNSRFYYPLFWGIVAKANARIGYIKSLGSRPIPLFERYFTGGVFSLRGFLPRSVGPTLQIPTGPAGGDEEFAYGGNKLLLFNGEIEFPIYDPAGLRWVFFVDAGNAFAEDEGYSIAKLRSNWGLGLRWHSPIGPLRFEWGVPFSRNPGEDKVVFNFTIGSLF